MNLMNYGYKEEKIKVRKMSMAELRIGVVQELLKKLQICEYQIGRYNFR